MKFLLIGIVAVVVIGVVLLLALGAQFGISLPGGFVFGTHQNGNGSPSYAASGAPTSSTTFVPSDFHGPTGPPHVNGPTSNPPNY